MLSPEIFLILCDRPLRTKIRGQGVRGVVEHLLSIYKALDSIANTLLTKEKKKKG
jgi:hypothetical protein